MKKTGGRIRQYFSFLFLHTWEECEEQTNTSLISRKSSFSAESKVIIILLYTAVGISITKYFGHTTDFLDKIIISPNRFDMWYCSFFFGTDIGKFHSMLYWIFVILLFYMVIPILIVKFIFREKLADYGFRIKNIHKDYPLFLILLVIMIPLVFWASSTSAFQERYPLFKPSKGNLFPVFLWWQLAYFFQFVAVEFFFRGFILHGIKHRFGFYAVFIMTIPYCLVHIGKPFAETMAAIFAGVILGTLSLKSRSVFMGVIIHFSVAITMDVMALWRLGYFSF